MDLQQRSLRIGSAVIGGAILIRLLSGGWLAPVLRTLTRPETVAVLMYLETGRVVRNYDPLVYPAESPVPSLEPPPAARIPEFTPADEELISIDDESGYDPVVGPLLESPLNWNLADGAPRVLILHTHGTESYSGETYEQTADYRTLDEGHNMLSIGDAVAERLEKAGIGVIHDRQLHDYPSYNGSYANARASIEDILAENPTVCLILDLHRDAAVVGDGQMDTWAWIDDREAAQLMLVVGTDAGGLDHPGWEENLALALKLQAQLEKSWPGLCRPLNLCAERFNGDMSPGALLVEVGAAGDTREEALLAARCLADGIIALARGANLTEDSTS